MPPARRSKKSSTTPNRKPVKRQRADKPASKATPPRDTPADQRVHHLGLSPRATQLVVTALREYHSDGHVATSDATILDAVIKELTTDD